jgi:hypothetical protein
VNYGVLNDAASHFTPKTCVTDMICDVEVLIFKGLTGCSIHVMSMFLEACSRDDVRTRNKGTHAGCDILRKK